MMDEADSIYTTYMCYIYQFLYNISIQIFSYLVLLLFVISSLNIIDGTWIRFWKIIISFTTMKKPDEKQPNGSNYETMDRLYRCRIPFKHRHVCCYTSMSVSMLTVHWSPVLQEKSWSLLVGFWYFSDEITRMKNMLERLWHMWKSVPNEEKKS